MGIAGHGGEFFRTALADEQAIKRIGVDFWQGIHTCRVSIGNIQQRETRIRKFLIESVCQSCGCLDLAEAGFDRDFPNAHDAHEDLVCGVLNRCGGSLLKFRIVAQKPQQRAGIQQQSHWYSWNSGKGSLKSTGTGPNAFFIMPRFRWFARGVQGRSSAILSPLRVITNTSPAAAARRISENRDFASYAAIVFIGKQYIDRSDQSIIVSEQQDFPGIICREIL